MYRVTAISTQNASGLGALDVLRLAHTGASFWIRPIRRALDFAFSEFLWALPAPALAHDPHRLRLRAGDVAKRVGHAVEELDYPVGVVGARGAAGAASDEGQREEQGQEPTRPAHATTSPSSLTSGNGSAGAIAAQNSCRWPSTVGTVQARGPIGLPQRVQGSDGNGGISKAIPKRSSAPLAGQLLLFPDLRRNGGAVGELLGRRFWDRRFGSRDDVIHEDRR